MTALDERKLARIRTLVAELSLLLEDEPEPTTPASAQADPWEADAEITVVGKVARPQFTTPKGKPLWSAGLAVDGRGGTIQWLNAICWGKTAEFARQFERGAEVEVVGSIKHESYVNKEGILREKQTFVIRHFVMADASSAG